MEPYSTHSAPLYFGLWFLFKRQMLNAQWNDLERVHINKQDEKKIKKKWIRNECSRERTQNSERTNGKIKTQNVSGCEKNYAFNAHLRIQNGKWHVQ